MKNTSFKAYRRQSMRIAKQLCFSREMQKLIANAKESREIYHLMIQGRLDMPD